MMVTIMFFIVLSDALLAAWLPIFLQTTLGNALLMGLIISFQSVIGLISDLIFPQLLKKAKLNRLMIYSLVLSVIYILSMILATYRPFLIALLIGMGAWGAYYEILGFANNQFVADTAPVDQRAKVWSVMGVARNLAYFVGPLLAVRLAFLGDRAILLVGGGLTLISFVLLSWLKLPNKDVDIEGEDLNPVKEIDHWRVLIIKTWPILLVSFMMGFIDAVFWTTGAVLGENLGKVNSLGNLFLPVYTFPSLFIGFVILKWGIKNGKKKWSEIFMLANGLLLIPLFLRLPIWGIITIVLVASSAGALAYPLIDAVYTDLISRLGTEGKHLMGLVGSVINLSYVIGPVAAGVATTIFGESGTFAALGLITAIVMAGLLIITPKKIRLPQAEIRTWE